MASKLWVAPITRDNLLLRLVTKADLGFLRDLRNDPTVRMQLLTIMNVTDRDMEEWWARYEKSDNDYDFIIEENATPVGRVAIYNIRWKEREAEFGRCMVLPEHRGNHVMLRAGRCIIDCAFYALALWRLWLKVKTENVAAIKTYEQLGFKTYDKVDAGKLTLMDLRYEPLFGCL